MGRPKKPVEAVTDLPYSVYKHTCPDGQVYVGITKQDPETRWLNGNGYIGQWFYQAVEKWGWANISHDILFSGLDCGAAQKLELELIDKFHSWCPGRGYNNALGGKAGSCPFPVRDKRTHKVYAHAKLCAADSGVSHYSVVQEARASEWTDKRFEYCTEDNISADDIYMPAFLAERAVG